jgi:hypothetical protein
MCQHVTLLDMLSGDNRDTLPEPVDIELSRERPTIPMAK